MNIVPIVNGGQWMGAFPRAVSVSALRRVPGQRQTDALAAATAAVVTAQAIVGRVRQNYNALLEAVGQGAANEAVQQSEDSMKKAEGRLQDLERLSGTTRA